MATLSVVCRLSKYKVPMMKPTTTVLRAVGMFIPPSDAYGIHNLYLMVLRDDPFRLGQKTTGSLGSA